MNSILRQATCASTKKYKTYCFYLGEQYHWVQSIQCVVKVLIYQMNIIHHSRHQICARECKELDFGDQIEARTTPKTQRYFIIILHVNQVPFSVECFPARQGNQHKPAPGRSAIEGMLLELLLKSS